MTTRRLILATAAAALAAPLAQAQSDTVKIGVLLPMTGQQASTGRRSTPPSSCGWRRTATRSPARRSR
jgi:uncharacterized protein (DUF2141 family)